MERVCQQEEDLQAQCKQKDERKEGTIVLARSPQEEENARKGSRKRRIDALLSEDEDQQPAGADQSPSGIKKRKRLVAVESEDEDLLLEDGEDKDLPQEDRVPPGSGPGWRRSARLQPPPPLTPDDPRAQALAHLNAQRDKRSMREDMNSDAGGKRPSVLDTGGPLRPVGGPPASTPLAQVLHLAKRTAISWTAEERRLVWLLGKPHDFAVFCALEAPALEDLRALTDTFAGIWKNSAQQDRLTLPAFLGALLRLSACDGKVSRVAEEWFH